MCWNQLPFARSSLLACSSLLVLGVAARSQTSAPQQQPREEIATIAPTLPVLQRAQVLGPVDAEEVLSLAISLPYARPGEIERFVDSVSDPRSSHYRQFLSPEEVGERFGLEQSRVDAVVDYLARSGFTITMVSKNRLAILATATVAQAQSAFHTVLRHYAIVPQDDFEPSEFIAYSTPIQLPVELASSVIDVSGLENYTRPRPLTTLLTPSLTSQVYDTVNMLAAGQQGQGRTIAISNWAGFRALNYIAYVTNYSLPIPPGGAGSNVTVVPCGGGGAGAGADSSEGELDIQMELGMAPLANIIVYDGIPTGNLIAVLAQESNDNQADVISESYGWNLPANNISSAHNLHLSITAQGITYVAASGDFGAVLDPYAYPDYDPEVLLVGGTVANVSPTTGARISEVGWSGSGGSWSTNTASFNVRPSWQTGPGVLPLTPQTDRRLVPDVAFHAAGNTTGAYPFYKNNMVLQTSVTGTSFASPIFAGMLAIVEQDVISRGGLPPDAQGNRRFGRMQDLIYSQAGQAPIWFDVVSGSNGHRPDGSNSPCTVGWDSVTGWGAMDCEAFVNAVAPPACTPPNVYCTSQVNSLQCLPSIAFSGQPSLSNSTPFLVTASNVLNNKSGLLFYGYQAQNLPFLGGTMCVHIPTLRTPVQNSGGSAFGNDCSGTFSFNFTTWINSGVDPQLQNVGQQFNCQYWSRDPQSSSKTNLTNAVEAHICP